MTLAAPTATGSPVAGSPATRGRARSNARRGWMLLALGVIVVAAAVASVVFGSREIPLHQVIAAFTAFDPDSIEHAAVLQRVPRTLLGLLIGAALGLSGGALQGVMRNPLADPGILGISSGAALAVLVGMAFFGLHSFTAILIIAFIGATLAAVLVYAIGSLGPGGATPLKLALAGAAAVAAFSSLTSAILLPRLEMMASFRFWQVGSIGAADLPQIVAVLPVILFGAVIVLWSARSLNAIALGDEVATSLGTSIPRARLLASLGAVLLAAAATALAGPIVFVGLVVPHVARLLFGSDYRWILGSSMLIGAALLLSADVLGRVLTRPADVEVGVMMALIGAPVFIAIVRSSKLREL